MKDIPEYESKYAITKDGKVYSYHSRRYMAMFNHKTGYKRIILNGKHHLVHRLVAITYLPNPDNKPFINHINGVKSDNRVENLEWCTRIENIRHAQDKLGVNFKAILKDIGQMPKLTYEQAQDIRKLKGKVTATELCKQYNVSASCILHIWSNRTYLKPN